MTQDRLPGEGLVRQGLIDLRNGVESVEALLVSIGAPRLRVLGLDVAPSLPDPEHRLYAMLSRSSPDAAHSRYNALIRRLVSFERALACDRWDSSRNTLVTVGVEAPARRGARNAHTGCMEATSNEARPDASAAAVAKVFLLGSLADAARIRRLMSALAESADAEARVYFTGGVTAVLHGWRTSTIDVDMKIVPDRDRLFRALPELKERLAISIELASPDDFIPVRAGWEDRSPFIARESRVSFHHFDLTAQALAKIERGHTQDLADVDAMLARGLVTREGLLADFDAIERSLYRYPALDPATFRAAVEAVTASRPPP
jgi:hypothetical protein